MEELEVWVERCIRLKAKHPKVEEEKLKYRAPTHTLTSADSTVLRAVRNLKCSGGNSGENNPF